MSSKDGETHGSGRSVPGFHLLDALAAVHTTDATNVLFTRFGGHAHAVGFSLPADRLPLLRARMKEHSRQQIDAEMLAPSTLCDLQVTPSDLVSNLAGWLAWIERCAPFGNGHCEPVFFCEGLLVAGPARIIKETHLCLPVAAKSGGAPINAMGWSRPGLPSWAERIANLSVMEGSRIDLAFRLRDNKHPSYGGIELELIDLAMHLQDADSAPSA